MILNLYNISILTLASIFIIINFIYKKPINVVILTSLILVIQYFNKNLINSIIIAYLISVIYGIFKNFHLLENFNQPEFDIKYDKNLIRKKTIKKPVKKPIKIKKNTQQYEDNLTEIHDKIIDLLNSNTLNLYIKHLKEKKNIKIEKKKMDINNLKPIKNSLDNNKINTLRNNNINRNSILVTKDFFIIDGHHRWFSKHTLLNQNLNYNVKVDKNVDVEILDINIKDFTGGLIDFKKDFNNSKMKQLNFDNNKLKEAKVLITNIKNNISKLESYYQDLNNIKLI
jgi:hypothetical protein